MTTCKKTECEECLPIFSYYINLQPPIYNVEQSIETECPPGFDCKSIIPDIPDGHPDNDPECEVDCDFIREDPDPEEVPERIYNDEVTCGCEDLGLVGESTYTILSQAMSVLFPAGGDPFLLKATVNAQAFAKAKEILQARIIAGEATCHAAGEDTSPWTVVDYWDEIEGGSITHDLEGIGGTVTGHWAEIVTTVLCGVDPEGGGGVLTDVTSWHCQFKAGRVIGPYPRDTRILLHLGWESSLGTFAGAGQQRIRIVSSAVEVPLDDEPDLYPSVPAGYVDHYYLETLDNNTNQTCTSAWERGSFDYGVLAAGETINLFVYFFAAISKFCVDQPHPGNSTIDIQVEALVSDGLGNYPDPSNGVDALPDGVTIPAPYEDRTCV